MTDADIKQMENEVFTKVVMDLFKEQQAAFAARQKNGEHVKFEYLLDKYEVDMITRERLKKILSEQRR